MKILPAILVVLVAGCSTKSVVAPTPQETRTIACEAKLRQNLNGQEGAEFTDHTYESDEKRRAHHVRGVARIKNEGGTQVRRSFHCQFDIETDALDIAVILDTRKAED